MEVKSNHNSQVDYLRILIYITIILLLLYFGQALFIPLSFALFLSFIIYPIVKFLENKNVSKILSIFIGLIIVLVPLIIIILLLLRQVFVFGQKYPAIKHKFIEAINKLHTMISDYLGIPLESLKDWLNKGISESVGIILSIVTNTITASFVSLVLLILIPVYVFLILYYRTIFIQFLNVIFPNQTKINIRSLLLDTTTTYYKFIKGMLIVYLAVGSLNSIGLYLFGIPDPFFYGFITSILTIIPYIGIMIGTLVPVALAWIIYDSIWYPAGIIAMFTFIQILEANVIFPLAVGNRLAVNPLIILLVVIGGGILWGVSGMILFIPFIGILKILSDRVENLKPLSIILGTGNKQT